MSEFSNYFKGFFNSDMKDTLALEKVQLIMSPPSRDLLLKSASKYTDAAVAVMIYKKNDDFYFPLIKRTSNNNDKHSGQISLPGGKFELADENLLNCSMRELEEEIGVESTKLTHIGDLNELLIPVSSFKVYPFVFYTEEIPEFTLQKSEVKELLEIRIKDLLANTNCVSGKVELNNGMIIDNTPYFQLNSNKIWGATAMILNEFKNVCSKMKTFHN
ncbi:MAG: CoA pyrophosphatase [Saprospiraceae bacterium]